MKKVITYITKDGKEFKTESSAKRHEDYENLKDKICKSVCKIGGLKNSLEVSRKFKISKLKADKIVQELIKEKRVYKKKFYSGNYYLTRYYDRETRECFRLMEDGV